jgi:Ni/Fe-hydrogenase subunit HybB-like protein
MYEKALIGSRRYWALLCVLAAVIFVGVLTYLRQLNEGMGITGLSRDVPWGLYIAQFTFLVGVAASAVMVVLPYYLHDYKAFGKVTILGEFLAIAAVTMCGLFIFVDVGQPRRFLNIMLHPTPNSVMFWDMISVMGYLGLNVVIARVTFGAEYKGVAPPRWIKPFIILSIPWAVSIHTVTAFLYSGLGARPFWMTAILAPRFLASAFAAGPSLLILLCLATRRFTKFDPGMKAIRTLSVIVAYGMAANVFFVLLELFTVLYSDIPEHLHHFQYLYFGLGEGARLVPWMWTSAALAVVSLGILAVPSARKHPVGLVVACCTVILSIWIEKGLGMVVAGFVPSPLGKVNEYWPTGPEITIAVGIYAVGALILLVLYKIATTVREEAA